MNPKNPRTAPGNVCFGIFTSQIVNNVDLRIRQKSCILQTICNLG